MSEKITGKYLTDRLYKLQMILKDNSDMMDEAGAEIIILRRENIELRADNEAKDRIIKAWEEGRLYSSPSGMTFIKTPTGEDQYPTPAEAYPALWR